MSSRKRQKNIYYRLTHSVTGRLVLLVLTAIGFGLIVYLLLHTLNSWIIDRTVLDTDLRSRLERRTVRQFEDFVEENHVSSTDYRKLNQWASERSEVSVTIYCDGKLQYDSTYGSENASDFLGVDEPDYDAETAYHIRFADGTADVVIADYSYVRLYDYAIILDVVLACLAALVVIVWNIHRTASYIVQLGREVQGMKGGDLEHPITIRGQDEITALAKNIDEFRVSIGETITTIENLEKTNSEMVAEISHDLRTPLTALIMYLQFARDSMADAATSADSTGQTDREKGSEQVSSIEFMDMAYDRAVYIRKMLEDTFTYFRPHTETEKDREPVFFPDALYDPLSDMAAFLDGIGMKLILRDELPEVWITGDFDSIRRVITNLCSNISKYADASVPVDVYIEKTRDDVSIEITNQILRGEHPKGTGLGTKIVDKLMRQMNGQYRAVPEDGRYETILTFKITERQGT